DLEEEKQDEILKLLENDEIDIPGANSSLFFEQLIEATLEGAYCDPAYGGNKNMAGWKMKEYPGVQMNYTEEELINDDFKKIKQNYKEKMKIVKVLRGNKIAGEIRKSCGVNKGSWRERGLVCG